MLTAGSHLKTSRAINHQDLRCSDIATIFLAIISGRNDVAETLSVLYTEEVMRTDAGYNALRFLYGGVLGSLVVSA